jgi:hypothetical protein
MSVHAARCVTALRRSACEGRLDTGEALAALADPVPGVRRAAAWALGVAGGGRAALEAAARAERTAQGALTLAVALARQGAAVDPLRASLRARESRTFVTALASAGDDGRRAPLALAPQDLEARFLRATGAAPVAESDVLARAEQGRPDDVAWLRERALGAGRREGHVLLEAWGLLGAPEGVSPLVDALRAMDVDPGAGFAQRRVAARALGRIGLLGAAPAVRDALAAEARDHEGRPGAGLGVQYPVRGALLLALGELQDAESVPLLVAHLDATDVGALGGLHLHAMEALVALGAVAVPALRATLRTGRPVAAAHAASVLHALGEPLPGADPRALVARVLRELGRGA